jgi:protein-S-isoprenylcysteine O-methyltransferase Ste14
VLFVSYFTDFEFTKNKIKSTDTTPLGILSCALCYYPLTILTNKFLYITDETLMPVNNQVLLAILNLFVIFAHLGILVAVLRLGTKSGNLTNRGIETKFPYNIVRHPEYSMQIFYIVLTTIPLLALTDTGVFEKFLMICATLGWIYLYYLRAITEERHLISDKKYQQYVEQVKYRFIPKLF